MFKQGKLRLLLKWVFRLLALSMAGLAIFFFCQTASVFLKALDLAWKFGTPDNLGYGIAFYLLVFTIGFVFLAVWFHKIAQLFGSQQMPPPGFDHPAQHDRVEDMPDEVGSNGDGHAKRLVQRARGEGNAED